ncbi:MAG: hypothetical protein KatS3mg051_1826 [Anaerolineae bacterium]|nr:MAG: hypothetical protein KatS3mg051_1826 [Anaerolineae bacterium]
MWLIPPSLCSASAPEPADSTSASEWRSEALARSVTLSEKPRQSRYWLRGWGKGGWTRLLYGLTCEPSAAQRGVESWISSLRASRASLTPSPDSAEEQPTTATCGQTSGASSESAALQLSLWRTSPASSPTTGEPSDRSFRTWATELRRCSRQQRLLGRPISGSAFSASHGSPASDGTLSERRWPTTTARDANRSAHRDSPNVTLTRAAEEWGSRWSTVTAHDHRAQDHTEYQSLSKTAERWQAERWLTPTANEDAAGRPGARMQQMLTQQAKAWTSSRQAQPPTGGQTSSSATPTSHLRLNPRFAEWLMGWPPGWTSLHPLDSD